MCGTDIKYDLKSPSYEMNYVSMCVCVFIQFTSVSVEEIVPEKNHHQKGGKDDEEKKEEEKNAKKI